MDYREQAEWLHILVIKAMNSFRYLRITSTATDIWKEKFKKVLSKVFKAYSDWVRILWNEIRSTLSTLGP